jgi:formylglycine-generating enzyme required for sulfatase activity
MRSALAGLFLVVAITAIAADDPKPADAKGAILKRFVDEFILLTPGKGTYPASFSMGSAEGPANEKPAHKVTFKAPFAMAKYEVTQELYEAVMGKNPAKWQGPRNSVEMVSWPDANEFCKKATAELVRRKLLAEGETIRLPSEAEWEYACRAGTTTKYSFGDKADELKDYAWFEANSKGEDPPVGKKKGNPWGFHDVHGYVSEWVQDAWHADYEGAPTDGSVWDAKEPKERVARSGSFADPADECRSAYRHHFAPDHRSDRVGFRCVLEKGEKR